MVKRVSIIFAVAIVIIIALSAFSWCFYFGHCKSSQKTKVVTLMPWQNDKVAAQYQVTNSLSGHCFAGSAATNREDAWRCMVGNQIFDPCFVASAKKKDGTEHELICFKTPWDNSVTKIKAPLNEKLGNREIKEKNKLPWAIELVGGSRCTTFTGATAPINGQRINYGCADGDLLVGGLIKNKPVWEILAVTKEQFADYVKTQKINPEKAQIKEVWY